MEETNEAIYRLGARLDYLEVEADHDGGGTLARLVPFEDDERAVMTLVLQVRESSRRCVVCGRGTSGGAIALDGDGANWHHINGCTITIRYPLDRLTALDDAVSWVLSTAHPHPTRETVDALLALRTSIGRAKEQR